MNQEVDIAFHLSIEDKDAVDATDGCSVKTFEVGYHYMMFHNMDATLGTTGALSDAGVRQAIDIAIGVLPEPDKTPAPEPVRMLLYKFGQVGVVDTAFAGAVENEQVGYQVPQRNQTGSFNLEAVHFLEQTVHIA